MRVARAAPSPLKCYQVFLSVESGLPVPGFCDSHIGRECNVCGLLFWTLVLVLVVIGSWEHGSCIVVDDT
jgi:hypothetical protein